MKMTQAIEREHIRTLSRVPLCLFDTYRRCYISKWFFLSYFLLSVPSELPILMREHFNRWYELRSYYLANKLADFPIQLTATFVYTIVVYHMTGQLPEGRRLGLYMLMCFIISLVAQAAGLIVGSGLKVQVRISDQLCVYPFLSLHQDASLRIQCY